MPTKNSTSTTLPQGVCRIEDLFGFLIAQNKNQLVKDLSQEVQAFLNLQNQAFDPQKISSWSPSAWVLCPANDDLRSYIKFNSLPGRIVLKPAPTNTTETFLIALSLLTTKGAPQIEIEIFATLDPDRKLLFKHTFEVARRIANKPSRRQELEAYWTTGKALSAFASSYTPTQSPVSFTRAALLLNGTPVVDREGYEQNMTVSKIVAFVYAQITNRTVSSLAHPCEWPLSQTAINYVEEHTELNFQLQMISREFNFDTHGPNHQKFIKQCPDVYSFAKKHVHSFFGKWR